MTMNKIRKQYVAPAMTIVRCEESLMENWSERTEHIFGAKEHQVERFDLGFEEEHSGYVEKNWLDYVDYNEEVGKNQQVHY